MKFCFHDSDIELFKKLELEVTNSGNADAEV